MHHDLPSADTGPDPAGPVRAGVVFVHGMRTSGAIWTPQLDAVRATGRGAVAIDLPGHGARRADRFTLDAALDVVDDAAAEVTASSPGAPWVLVGLSLGGYAALAYAARRAGSRAGAGRARAARPGAGVLAGVVAAACTTETRGVPLRMFQAGLRGALATGRGTARRTTPDSTADATDTAAPGWDLVADALRDLSAESSVENLRRADVPVWLVNGARDRLRLHEWRHRRVPGTRLVVVPHAGHDVSVEAPEAFSRTVLEALDVFERAADLGVPRPGATLGA
ncbi:alpha/beta fold hydrolase [Luteimicrobium subarcticum]|uniref:Alpha-beta hydrolase superfamily lysophospholipase n=1 Tax=Luteimicrobium subarcticum TaxID=620910 RepID=A0A2M8WUZ8_9MICO|nr:alpha/beta hydrolase [Luteimicrobium subarcticum]PJI94761.1 alpha-beta hydrolase superfamily lysophospholipase [Luteimicrobium subarcticum]